MNAQSPKLSSLALACAAALGIAAGSWHSPALAQAYVIPGATPASAPAPSAAAAGTPPGSVATPGGTAVPDTSAANVQAPAAPQPPSAAPSFGMSRPNTPFIPPPAPAPQSTGTPAGATTSSTPIAPAPLPPPAGVVAAPRPPLPPPPSAQPVKGLPADAPKLVISGGVYSANPEQRRVIVNGQVAREGADLGSGVVVQQINADGVVLAFRGSQYRVAY